MKKYQVLLFALSIAMVGIILSGCMALQSPTPFYSIIATIPVGQVPEGVAVNPNTNTIYVANNGSNNVSVINGNTNQVIATIPVGQWPYGVAVNPNTNTIYVANNDSNNMSVINGNTDQVIATTPVGQWPVGVAVNRNTGILYVINSGNNTVDVIKPGAASF